MFGRGFAVVLKRLGATPITANVPEGTSNAH